MKVLLTEAEIADGVRQLAERIAADWGGSPMTLVGVLTGSLVLVADLIRHLRMPVRVNFVQASSYRNNTSRGDLVLGPLFPADLEDRDVLLVDDIFDTGHTLVEVTAALRTLGPRSIRTAVLLRKAARQEVDVLPDFIAFEIPDRFVVGYGLDYRDEYRNLPYIAELEPGDAPGDEA